MTGRGVFLSHDWRAIMGHTCREIIRMAPLPAPKLLWLPPGRRSWSIVGFQPSPKRSLFMALGCQHTFIYIHLRPPPKKKTACGNIWNLEKNGECQQGRWRGANVSCCSLMWINMDLSNLHKTNSRYLKLGRIGTQRTRSKINQL